MVARVMIGGTWTSISDALTLTNHPGHADQKSHGRKGGDVKVISHDDGWSGGYEYQYSSDQSYRDASVWSQTFHGQRAVRDVIRNLDAGREPFDGVDTEGGFFAAAGRARNWSDDSTYGREAVATDVLTAASNLRAGLNSPDTFDQPLYRGMRVPGAADAFSVGTKFSSDVSSWSTHKQTAEGYTSPEPESGRPATGDRVVMSVTGGKGVGFSDAPGSRAQMAGEHLLRGAFRVTSSEWEDGVLRVTVEPS